MDLLVCRYISNDSDALTRPGFGEKRAKSVKQVSAVVVLGGVVFVCFIIGLRALAILSFFFLIL